jgi:transposase
MKTQKEPWRKKTYEKVTLELKIFVVDQIQNGQMSTNFTSKKYSTLMQQNTGMSRFDQIKKLEERIEELEFVKNFQQDIIADMELIKGVDMSKKSLPNIVAKKIALNKKHRLKEKGSISVLGFVNKPSIKDVKHKKTNS